ncbi:LOW QUALITY PROTEIN: HSPB1-associated protein 1 homolog [Boleophthalmus pectinirostris]|uniref:LOW QUALITY PROTEIN: HSPB1-associated protein 1 homolog n=1 Tax=Boleophthalmus pectinirostris TaxID=150288 RepID=UPI00242D9F85|nr:LOW QUALITY PROTEIN: HSPB1-associated protein 1 homolog [Boleophthalmus pectinirostris]
MAYSSAVKPFSPDEAYRLVHQLQQPAVFLNMTKDWPVLGWTAQHLSQCLRRERQEKQIRFRLGKKEKTNCPLFETQCSYVNASLSQFLRWAEGDAVEEVGPFSDFPKTEYWAYADYKYIAEVFEDLPSMFEDVRWCDFGFEGRGGRESTLWIGTEGADTPCHLDSYGFNLVLQVQGRKRWRLFPPEDTPKLYPTRIPYEESSIFSRVDVLNPDLNRFKDFRGARAHCVTLLPGQVLFVPRHWWHYVESVDPVTVSVNTWIELDEDNEARVSEAVTKAVVCAFKTAPSEDNMDVWLNPTVPEVPSYSDNMDDLNIALRYVNQKHPSSKRLPHLSAKRNHTGHILNPSSPISPPFGPHLVPVHCQTSIDPTGTSEKTYERARKHAKICQTTEEDMERPRGARQGASVVDFEAEREGLKEREEENEGVEWVTVSTNELLDCLVHPEVIKRVTELLIQRHAGDRGTAPD